MKTQIFSFKRLSLLLKKQMREDWKRQLILTIIPAILMTISFYIYWWISGLLNLDANNAKLFGIQTIEILYVTIIPLYLLAIMIAYQSAHSMPFMSSKTSQIAYLLLPATSAEKYAMTFIISFFVTFIECVIAFIIADLAQYLYSGQSFLLLFGDIDILFQANGVLSNMTEIFGPILAAITFYIISSFFFVSAWYMMSATVFRKHPFLLGSLCYFGLSQILKLFMLIVLGFSIFSFSQILNSPMDFDIITDYLLYKNICNAILTLLLWIWSYIRMSKVEL